MDMHAIYQEKMGNTCDLCVRFLLANPHGILKVCK